MNPQQKLDTVLAIAFLTLILLVGIAGSALAGPDPDPATPRVDNECRSC